MKFADKVAKGAVKIFVVHSSREEQELSEQAKSGKVLLVDFKNTDLHTRQLMLSFLEGTMFGLNGRLIPLREDLVLLVPPGALADDVSEVYKVA
ncbi:hypothetical protein NO2_0336 [Candidatus Termititenax persephonae]|uniref:Cell division protein SepF n=1 Tax=Candidatus Termititenax persephonae TaxID=2218525 RepID=A0A388THB0_9BACT|nr:hypothetical protein NO2_0336 [Candidatus Termititenax persephonae]